MNYTRKNLPQENNTAGPSLLSAPKDRELPGKGKDTVEKPFPSKAVCHKKLVSSTSQKLDLKKGSVSKKSKEHDPAAEAQMSRIIQEKQLMLQKKLWKVEDALRQKARRDNGTGNKCNSSNEEDKHDEKQVTGREVLGKSPKNSKQYKFRQDTITKRHEPQDAKWDNVPSRKTMSTKKEDRATYVYNEPTGDNENAAERSTHEELVLPQVTSNPPWKLELSEGADTNIQLLPCHICNRNFLHDRVEKHMQICEKATKSKRPVFNSYENRTKGSAAEEFWKTHTRNRTPEVLRKKKQRQLNKNNH